MWISAKFELSGPDSSAFLDRVVAGSVPKPGRTTLAHMLTTAGKVGTKINDHYCDDKDDDDGDSVENPDPKVYAELTITCLEEGKFWIITGELFLHNKIVVINLKPWEWDIVTFFTISFKPLLVSSFVKSIDNTWFWKMGGRTNIKYSQVEAVRVMTSGVWRRSPGWIWKIFWMLDDRSWILDETTKEITGSFDEHDNCYWPDDFQDWKLWCVAQQCDRGVWGTLILFDIWIFRIL